MREAQPELEVKDGSGRARCNPERIAAKATVTEKDKEIELDPTGSNPRHLCVAAEARGRAARSRQ